MPSEFDEFMGEGAEETFSAIGTVPIKCGTVSKGCVAAPFLRKREMQGAGYWDETTTTAEILRADFVALGITVKGFVVVGGKRLRVVHLEDDLHDPCVRVFLKPEN